jgi:hypothetical protein
MDVEDAAAQQQAQQRWLETITAHRMMASMSDHPGQFDHNPMQALLRQAQRELYDGAVLMSAELDMHTNYLSRLACVGIAWDC